jgi:hypothetical protein
VTRHQQTPIATLTKDQSRALFHLAYYGPLGEGALRQLVRFGGRRLPSALHRLMALDLVRQAPDGLWETTDLGRELGLGHTQSDCSDTTKACICCGGTGSNTKITYAHLGICPRCDKSGVEPELPPVHVGLVLRNVRSGKVWAVYGSYEDGEWGIHRMKPSRRGGHYVWQIILRPARELLDESRWVRVGFGDAWNHQLMEADALGGDW